MSQPQPPTLVIKPNHVPRPKKLNLEHLPLEVVLRIYEFALVERPRWEKTHKLTCKHKPKFGDYMHENPPFLQSRINITYDMRITTNCPCDCAKRTGLGLLLASKGVNELAAPIFWSQNTFCFLDASEVVATVGRARCLRIAYHEMIKHISVMNPSTTGNPIHVESASTRGEKEKRHTFWATIRKCKNLESLDIPAPYVQRIVKFRKQLPFLKTLRLNFLLTYCSHFMWTEYPSPWYDHSFHNVTYVRCAQTVPIEDLESGEAVRKLLKNSQYNFRVYVNTQVKTKFLGATLDTLETYYETFELASDIDEYSNKRRITLPTGERTTVEFYGLPLSKRDRLNNAKQKRVLDGKQKKLNKLGHSQNEAVVKAKENRKTKRDQEASENRMTHSRKIEERGQRVLDLKAEEEKAARKQQRKINAMTRRKAEIQRCERKRVPCY